MSPLHTWESPVKERTNEELVALSLPSHGPKRGRKCYVTRAFSGIPQRKGTT